MVSNPYNPKSLSARFRLRRAQQFIRGAVDHGISNARILDIGGTIEFWKVMAPHLPSGLISNIEIVNLPPQAEEKIKIGDICLNRYAGNALEKDSIRQDSYDIVHSNSVIEHVGGLRDQISMAGIIRDLGQYYWVQTPARSFPLEPHFYFPFFPYLPLGLRTLLHQRFDLGFMKRNPDWLQARAMCEETRLLTCREMAGLFEDGEIIKERFLGLCKSYVATNLPPLQS